MLCYNLSAFHKPLSYCLKVTISTQSILSKEKSCFTATCLCYFVKHLQFNSYPWNLHIYLLSKREFSATPTRGHVPYFKYYKIKRSIFLAACLLAFIVVFSKEKLKVQLENASNTWMKHQSIITTNPFNCSFKRFRSSLKPNKHLFVTSHDSTVYPTQSLLFHPLCSPHVWTKVHITAYTVSELRHSTWLT